jgi:hypothetical protein
MVFSLLSFDEPPLLDCLFKIMLILAFERVKKDKSRFVATEDHRSIGRKEITISLILTGNKEAQVTSTQVKNCQFEIWI